MSLANIKTTCGSAFAIAAIALVLFPSVSNAENTPLPIAKDTNWSLRLPKDEKVFFKGVVDVNTAGAGSTQMLYPAPNALGFLAAVFTHGAIVEAQKKSEKDRLQDEANKVLGPYEPILKDYSHKELMERALAKTAVGSGKKLVAFSDKPSADWSIESVPIFSMTQDQSAIVLESAISVYPPNATTPAYQNAVRVISQTKDSTDFSKFWTANGGEKLKEESASLLAHSLDIAIAEAANPPGKDNVQKTFRYSEGNVEKMERAELISEQCDRAVIKTLRGWLMSIPARRTPDAAPCGNTISSTSLK